MPIRTGISGIALRAKLDPVPKPLDLLRLKPRLKELFLFGDRR